MEEIKLNVKALAAQMGMSIGELATACGINPTHLNDVSSGRVKMTGYDLQKLSEYTRIPADNIKAN